MQTHTCLWMYLPVHVFLHWKKYLILNIQAWSFTLCLLDLQWMRTVKLGAQSWVRNGKENWKDIPVCSGIYFARNIQWPNCQHELSMETFPACLGKHRTGEESKDTDPGWKQIHFLLSPRQKSERYSSMFWVLYCAIWLSGKVLGETRKKRQKATGVSLFWALPYPVSFLTFFLEWMVPMWFSLSRISLSSPVGSIFAASHAGTIPHSYMCVFTHWCLGLKVMVVKPFKCLGGHVAASRTSALSVMVEKCSSLAFCRNCG